MLIPYVPKKFSKESLAVIAAAKKIMADFERQGFKLSLRQLYYQFVSQGLIPNSQRDYKRLGSIVNDGRLAGMLSWKTIEDRGRNFRHNVWDTAEDMLDDAIHWYRQKLWVDQPYYPEVWVEKDALVGVIEPACDEYRTGYIACRGYLSQSEQWGAAMRILSRWRDRQQTTIVLHLGDHDPSGIDMTRDNLERLQNFLLYHTGSSEMIEVRRLALNMDQVQQYDPPPNPTKLTDSRADGYLQEHGDESWELDALTPTVIHNLITSNLEAILDDGDRDAFEGMKAEENRQKDRLESAAAWLRDQEKD